MGRGRAKAKQTKVARELKYSSPGMDLDRLSRDLHTPGEPGSSTVGDEESGAPGLGWDEDSDEDSAAS